MKLHREGRLFVTKAFVFSIVAVTFFIKTIDVFVHKFILVSLTFAILLFLIYFFRNPRIELIKVANGVVAPASGKVVKITKVYENEYFEGKKIMLSIFMSPLDVHVNRNPVSGKINYFKHHHGNYLVAFHPKSSEKNERTTIVIENCAGIEIMFRQVAGYVARRIKFYNDIGNVVEQGAECGFIKFGSRADIFLPLDADVKVQVGDSVKAGRSVLADL